MAERSCYNCINTDMPPAFCQQCKGCIDDDARPNWSSALSAPPPTGAQQAVAPDDLKLTLLMAPYHLNLVVGHDRAQLLAFGRDVWAAAKRGDSPTVRTRNLAEASAALDTGTEGKEVQHGTATASAVGTNAAPVNPEGGDSVTNALAAPAAPSDPSGQKQRSDAWLAVSDAIKEHWAGTAAVGAEDAVRLIAMLAAEAKAYRAAGRPAAGAQQAVATRIAGEAAAFRWLIANRITEDKNGCLQLHYETSRQGKDHPDKQWVANDIAWEAGVDLAALTASAAAQRADCARCKGVGAVGDHNGERAVEISCDHCGGTGRAPSATPAPEAAPSAKEGEAPMLLATAPEHIWLDLGEDFDGDPATTAFHELSDQTWSEDNASGKGIKYVRVGIEGLTPAGGER